MNVVYGIIEGVHRASGVACLKKMEKLFEVELVMWRATGEVK
jgi:hypothetical protein